MLGEVMVMLPLLPMELIAALVASWPPATLRVLMMAPVLTVTLLLALAVKSPPPVLLSVPVISASIGSRKTKPFKPLWLPASKSMLSSFMNRMPEYSIAPPAPAPSPRACNCAPAWLAMSPCAISVT